jgi:hypothetical protein
MSGPRAPWPVVGPLDPALVAAVDQIAQTVEWLRLTQGEEAAWRQLIRCHLAVGTLFRRCTLDPATALAISGAEYRRAADAWQRPVRDLTPLFPPFDGTDP